jgi:hypothetical protein
MQLYDFAAVANTQRDEDDTSNILDDLATFDEEKL